jgi:hypothetical protein
MYNKFKKHNILLVFLLCVCVVPVFAHDVVVEMENLSNTDTALVYFLEGFKHIIPLGVDHILFIVGLMLTTTKLKPILLQATAFTVAHTITLGLTMLNIIQPVSSIVEPIIALTIAYVAIENLVAPQPQKWRLLIIFIFGLVHGMGFASALAKVGMPQNSFFTALLLFNVGVEVAQITIILFTYFLLVKWFWQKKWYHKRVVQPASVLLALVAVYWTLQRLFF